MNAQEYNLNIRVGYGFPQTVKISQDDAGRPLSFHLLDGAEALTIPSGATVTIHGTKPSGLGFTETCTVTGSTASIETTLEMSQEFGNCPAELVVAVGDDLIGTANFTMFVERSPHPENTIDGTFDVADSIFARMDDLEDELDEVKEDLNGWSDDTKVALLNAFAHVSWQDGDGQDYIAALEAALYAEEPKTLVSISAVYTQSGTVYDTDTLDSLKSDLVVTAHYSDSTTATITSGYALSGSLEIGTSTITVTYEGKTTTFTVEVSDIVPSAYTRMTYVQSDGACYVDTGIYHDDKTKSVIDYMSLKNSGQSFQCPIGSSGNSSNAGENPYFFYIASANGVNGSMGGEGTGVHLGDGDTFQDANPAIASITIDYGDRKTYTLDGANKKFVIDTTEYSVYCGFNTVDYQNSSIMLFARNHYNGTPKGLAVGRIYSCQIYDDGTLIADYIPVKRISDNEYGFYDAVSETFKTNSGTGTLTGGN